MRTLLCATAALILHTTTAWAQVTPRPLSLPEARALARASSPELRAAQSMLDAATARVRQAGAFSNPVVSYARESVSAGGAASSQDIVSAQQPLDITGLRSARRDAADLRRLAAEARVRDAAAQLDHDVTRRYAAAVAAGQHANLAESAGAAFDRALRISAARLADGDVSGYQHRRLALEAARYNGLRLSAMVARDTVIIALRALLGTDAMNGTTEVTLVDTTLPRPLELSLDSLSVLALANRTDIVAMQFESDALAADGRVLAAERIPVPTLIAGYKRERTGGITLDGYVAGLSLTLPVWNRQDGAIAAAQAESTARAATVALRQRQVLVEVASTFASHQALETQLRALGAQLDDNADLAVRSADTAYTEGEISLLEWLDATRAWHDARAAYSTLVAEYLARRAALERATGASLL